MKYFLILSILTLSACGKPYVEPEMQMYVNRWNSIYPITADNTELRFVDKIEANVVGSCNFNNNSIVILRSYFNDCYNQTSQGQKTCDLKREQLIFHELGHCVLKLGHDSNHVLVTDELGVHRDIYRSIMYPAAFGDDAMYEDNLEYYHEQL